MISRREFGILGASAVGLAAFNGVGRAAPKTGEKIEHTEHHEQQKCAEACSDCQRACDSCATHCAHLLHDGQKEHITTLMTCQDCADICAAASQMVARGGPFAALICEPCAEACAKCGEECEKFPNDEHMAMCAKECRKCEDACREMLKHADHAHS